VHASIVDLYCIEPFPKEKFLHFVKTHGNCLIVAEDHYSAGGIGEKVCSLMANDAINCLSLAVNKVPHSGTQEELLEYYGLDAANIVRKALFMIQHRNYS
jgi:transketolase